MMSAWLMLGFGNGFGRYDAAFGAPGCIEGTNARKAITRATLKKDFASTFGLPQLARLGNDRMAENVLRVGRRAHS